MCARGAEIDDDLLPPSGPRLGNTARAATTVPRRGWVLAAALMAIFMPAVESSIVATALPTIIGDLGGFHLFSWVFAIQFLTMAVTIP